MTNLTPFQRLPGDAFDRLPEPVRRLHGLGTMAHTAGLAEITAARNPAAWLLCKLAGLTLPAISVPRIECDALGIGDGDRDLRVGARMLPGVVEQVGNDGF